MISESNLNLSDDDNLSENYKWNIMNEFFKEKGFVAHQIDTFDVTSILVCRNFLETFFTVKSIEFGHFCVPGDSCSLVIFEKENNFV